MFPPKQVDLQPAPAVKRSEGRFVTVTGSNGKEKRIFVYEDDLSLAETWERIQHRNRELTETHSVYRWAYLERIKMQRMVNEIIFRLDQERFLTRAMMDFAKSIEMPMGYIPPHLRPMDVDGPEGDRPSDSELQQDADIDDQE